MQEVEPPRALRHAVREAHKLGVKFRIRGANVEIEGDAQQLRDTLDPETLYEYLGAAAADREAITFLEGLGVEAILVEDVTAATAALDELAAAQSPFVGLDIETTPKPAYAELRPAVRINADGSVGRAEKDKSGKPAALDPHRGDIALLQLFAGTNRCFGFRGAALEHVLNAPWFREQTLIAHNAVFEESYLRPRGLDLKIGCTLQAGGLMIGVGEGGEKRSLANVAREVLGIEPPKALQLSDWGALRLSVGQVAYAAADAVLAYQLWQSLQGALTRKRRKSAYLLQRRAIPAVAAMEYQGLLLDQDEHARQTADWVSRLEEARRVFRGITGKSAPTTPNEIQSWLCEVIPAEILKWWPRTQKTRELSVEGKHLKRVLNLPGISEVIAMRSMQQRLSNFGEKLTEFISPATGRIHASYNLASTKTGRFSCSKPNLQQLPGDKAAPEFRRCIIAASGYVLIGCDWSQVEMRAAAWISGCRTMTAIYRADPVRDLHRETASIGPVKLAEDAFDSYNVVMSEAEAKTALDRFFQTYHGFNDWRWDHWHICKGRQVVVPGSGRTVEASWEYNNALRFTQCCNVPIQGMWRDNQGERRASIKMRRGRSVCDGGRA
jgi:DNA polymerase-1